jgi:hypothetical protein
MKKTQYYVILNFLTQNVEYIHKYEAIPTKTYKTVDI